MNPEKRSTRKDTMGHLLIFFGMAAGVGKTYAMLQAARESKEQGVDVVIGVIHTHGREEIGRLAEGFERIPEREVTYRGVVLKELNLNAILYRKPQLVLVDELAHSNVPGSRHPYRWQDVLDILQAGIDVYTTINVQHVESRKEIVENITGVVIRETVPDSVFELASQIKLVDIAPSELLQRLRQGKVYLGEKSTVAAEHFFKEDRLTALREIALRFTAEKVDHDLQEMMRVRVESGEWRATERLLVAVSHSPFSQQLIRATRRLAFTLKAPWMAVHVDTGVALNTVESETLAKNLSLARQLGAEVFAVADPDVPLALKRIVNEKHISQLVVGRPTVNRLRDIFTSSLLVRLAEQVKEADIHVARQEPIAGVEKPKWPALHIKLGSQPAAYWATAAFLGLIAAVNHFLLMPLIGYQSVALVFVVALLSLSLYAGKGPILLATLLSILLWNTFFVPEGLISSSDPEDLVIVLTFLIAGLTSALLSGRARRREIMLRQRDAQSQMLYELMREVANNPDQVASLNAIAQRMRTLLPGTAGFALKDENDQLILEPSSQVVQNEKERAVAIWVLRNGRPAGWSTDTLASVGVLYLPLKGARDVVGVMAYRPGEKTYLSLEDMNFAQSITYQLALALERTQSEERERQTQNKRQIESLQNSILHSVSEELKTPLEAAKQMAEELANHPPADRKEEVSSLCRSVEELCQGLNNLVELSKFSTGVRNTNPDYQSVGDLIQAAVQSLSIKLADHRVRVDIEEGLPFVFADGNLMELVFKNLLSNAANAAPAGTEIIIEAKRQDKEVLVSVADQGPGIPAEALARIFEKFYKLTPGGLGLGLALAKAIVDLHRGRIDAVNKPEGGAIFTVALPIEARPKR